MKAAEASLKRLNTDWIDLYQVHFPDPNTPIEETLRALDDLVRQGKVRAIGCSNFSAKQVDEAQDTTARHKLTAFVTNQDEYSLLVRDIENELDPAMEKHGLRSCPTSRSPAACSPASTSAASRCRKAHGSPTAAHHIDFINDRNWALVEKLDAVAAKTGHSMLELAFGWLLGKPIVASVIAGATTPEQVEQNVKASERRPPAAILAELDRITA